MQVVEKLTPFGKAMVVDDKYIVTRSGDVYSYWENHKKWKKQKLRENTNGYLRANIHGSDFYIHSLVAICYLENPNKYNEVNHKDGDKHNNCVDNLEWCNRSQNNKHAFTTGLRSYDELSRMAKMPKRKSRKITFSDAEEIRRIVGKTDKEIAEIYGISRGSVWQIRKGITYARA